MKMIFMGLLLFAFAVPVLSQVGEVDSLYVDSLGYYEADDFYENDDVDETESSGYLGEIGLVFGNPFGQMKKRFEKTFFGYDFGLYKQFDKTIPLYVGAGFFIMGYDSESVDYFDYGQEDGVEYEFRDEFKGKVFGFNLGAKYFSNRSLWVFNPYVQLDIEYRRAYAAINYYNVDLDESINTDFEGGNSSLGYDLGFGSIINVNSDKFYLDFRVSYCLGGGLFLYIRNTTSSGIYVTDYFDKKYIPIGYGTIKIGVTFF